MYGIPVRSTRTNVPNERRVVRFESGKKKSSDFEKNQKNQKRKKCFLNKLYCLKKYFFSKTKGEIEQ